MKTENKKKKKLPIMAKTLVMGTLANIGGQLASPAIDMLTTWIKNKALYSLSLKHDISNISPVLLKYYPDFPKALQFWMANDEDDAVVIEAQQAYMNLDEYVGVTWYKGAPIILTIEKPRTTELGTRKAVNQKSNIVTLQNEWCISKMHEFIKVLYNDARKYKLAEHIKCPSKYKFVEDGVCLHASDRNRTFDDVFIPEKDRKKLQESISAYVNGNMFYQENNLPNHFGILLHGAAGGGKSSLAQAIADYAHAQLYVMNGDQIRYLPRILAREVCQRPMTPDIYRVLLIEDIDSGVFSLNRDNWKPDKSKSTDTAVMDILSNVGIATILNSIDGFGSPTNIIYIFTTNHIEMLDPALIRPGRCDIVMELGYVCAETLTQFLKKHFPNETIPVIHDNQLDPKITFAELQTQLLLGKSMEDVIKYCRK